MGAGAIGVEFATLYHQLGVPVQLVEALDRLVPLEDPDVSGEVAKQFKAAGIQFRTSARVKAVEETKDGVHVAFEEGEPLEAEKLLVAIGREPLSKDAGLEAAGVNVGKGGFVGVDEWMRTSAQGVWAIGDLVGGFLLAHAAAHEGIVAAEGYTVEPGVLELIGRQATGCMRDALSLLDQLMSFGDGLIMLEQVQAVLVTRTTYSQPQIASVGLTEPEAREQGREVKVGKFPFLANGRALIHGEPGGFAKLVADAKTGQLLGAHIVGVEATELIAEPALARLFQGDAWEVSRNIHPHPTLSEVVGEAALAVDGSAIHI